MRKIVKRKNQEADVVACAWKLAVLLWHVLSSGEPFRYAQPKSLAGQILQAACTNHRATAQEWNCQRDTQIPSVRARAHASGAVTPSGFCRKRPAATRGSPQGRKDHAGTTAPRHLLPFCHELQTPSRVRPNEPA